MYRLEKKEKVMVLAVLIEALIVLGLRKMMLPGAGGGIVWQLLIFSIFCFFILPLVTIKVVFHQKAEQYYWRLNLSQSEWFRGGIFTFILLAATAGCMVLFDWDKFFVVSDWLTGGRWVVVFIDLLVLPVIVLSFEFFFRGFLLVSTEKAWSFFWAIIVSTGLSSLYLFLFNKDLIGFRLAYFVFVNLMLGVIARVSKSIFISALASWLLMLLLDFAVLLKIIQMTNLAK